MYKLRVRTPGCVLGSSSAIPSFPLWSFFMNTSTTHRNIREICSMEQEVLARRSLSARLGDTIATHAGRMWFIALHAAWFFVWIVVNVEKIAAFDPFPFSLLTMIVSLESIFLSLFIIMSQNRSSIQADQRNHLDLQINLLSLRMRIRRCCRCSRRSVSTTNWR